MTITRGPRAGDNLLEIRAARPASLIGVPHSGQALSASDRPRLVRDSEALLVFIAVHFLVKRDDAAVSTKDDRACHRGINLARHAPGLRDVAHGSTSACGLSPWRPTRSVGMR